MNQSDLSTLVQSFSVSPVFSRWRENAWGSLLRDVTEILEHVRNNWDTFNEPYLRDNIGQTLSSLEHYLSELENLGDGKYQSYKGIEYISNMSRDLGKIVGILNNRLNIFQTENERKVLFSLKKASEGIAHTIAEKANTLSRRDIVEHFPKLGACKDGVQDVVQKIVNQVFLDIASGKKIEEQKKGFFDALGTLGKLRAGSVSSDGMAAVSVSQLIQNLKSNAGGEISPEYAEYNEELLNLVCVSVPKADPQKERVDNARQKNIKEQSEYKKKHPKHLFKDLFNGSKLKGAGRLY